MGDKSGMSSNKDGLMQTGNCTITWSAFSTTWTPFYCVFNQTYHSKARKIKPKPPKYVHQQEQMSEWAAKWLMNSESQTKTSCCSLLFHCVVTTKDSQLQSNESEDTERKMKPLFPSTGSRWRNGIYVRVLHRDINPLHELKCTRPPKLAPASGQ